MLLVTGITGHSGEHFLREVIAHDHREPLRCLVRGQSDTTLLRRSGLDVDVRVGDLTDQAFVTSAMAGVERVLHISSIFHSEVIAHAMARHGVAKGYFVHTTGIYSRFKDASADYQRIEAQVRATLGPGADPTFLRPTMIYGRVSDNNMIVFIRLIDRLPVLPVIDHGRALIQPVNGRDLGRAYYQVITTPTVSRGDYNLSGDRPRRMREMFEEIAAALERRTRFPSVPLRAGLGAACAVRLATRGRVDYVERVLRMTEDRSFSHEQATRDFGYRPMPFAEGIAAEVAEYRRLRV